MYFQTDLRTVAEKEEIGSSNDKVIVEVSAAQNGIGYLGNKPDNVTVIHRIATLFYFINHLFHQ